MGYTSLGPKNYDLQIGTINHLLDKSKFKTNVTDVIVRCKGLSLKNECTKGAISKDLMRQFLYALTQQEKLEIKLPQFRFEILWHSFKIRPQSYYKTYNNINLFQKRLFNPNISLSKTYPIGAVAYYD